MSIDCLPSTTTSRSLGYEEPDFDDSYSSRVDVEVGDIDGLFDHMETRNSKAESFREVLCEEEKGTESPKKKKKSSSTICGTSQSTFLLNER